MIDITNGVRVFGVSFRAGIEAPALANSDTWVRGYARPALPAGWFWMLDTVSVENTNPAGRSTSCIDGDDSCGSRAYPQPPCRGG